ncbi:hypothetical protein PHISP_05706 [Aspergillus sp. HF37]|nr:hypothetical protein PHISP_05706 [Aspergillus sp. HF37]
MARSGKMKAKAAAKGRKAPASAHAAPSFPSHLTMQQAAKNVEGRRNLWSGSQLRHRSVVFVSAGAAEPEETDSPSSRPDEANREPVESKQSPVQDVTEMDFTVGREAADVLNPPIDASSESVSHTQVPNPVPEPCLPTPRDSPEDSSEDEIVFQGRCNAGKPTQEPQGRVNQMGSDFLPTPRYVTEDEAGRTELDGEEREEETVTTTSAIIQSTSDGAATAHHPPAGRSTTMDLSEEPDYVGINPPRAKRGTRRPRTEDESDALEDYIANMDDYEDILRTFNLKGGIDTPDTPDSDALSLSQKSSTPSATHDMDALFEAGNSPPSHTLPERGGKGRRGSDGSKCKVKPQHDVHSRADEIKERRSTKQEKLPVPHIQPDDDLRPDQSSDEDVLSESEAEEVDLDLDVLQSEILGQSIEFDPLDELDLLVPSKAELKKKSKKQRRAALELDLSDSELEFELEQAWQKDRGKKKAKKQKREEIRSQGMLGRGAGKPDLKVKYSDGMDIDDFRVETKRFLLSSKNSLSLPPMKKQQRKLVHELASALSLKSQSRGNGPSRFPVLNKTGRTPPFTPKTINQVDKVFSRGKFSRGMGKSRKQDTADKSGSGRRGRKDNSASYMDGDVVGASAPEIGAGNKGRAMLEKMGWSMGTALGATNNKGILQPVAHVVKNSRVGLG